jgi:hypothetical protein
MDDTVKPETPSRPWLSWWAATLTMFLIATIMREAVDQFRLSYQRLGMMKLPHYAEFSATVAAHQWVLAAAAAGYCFWMMKTRETASTLRSLLWCLMGLIAVSVAAVVGMLLPFSLLHW